MRIALQDLLRTKVIVHPSKLEHACLENERLTVRISGHPWWIANSIDSAGRTLELIFEDVSWGGLDLCLPHDTEELLERFHVRALSGIDWAQPANNSVYCYAKLLEPTRLYVLIEEYLDDEGAFLKPSNFLNPGSIYDDVDFSWRKFIEIVSSESYCLARMPDCLQQIVLAELDKQGVPHNVIASKLLPENRLWVQLGASEFLCREAFAVFEP